MKIWGRKFNLFRDEFHADSITVFAGHISSAIISFLALPALTRIFSPEIFGQFQFILACVAVLSVFATLQYELAIVLPDELKKSDQVVLLCLITTVFVSVIYAYVGIYYGNEIISLFNIDQTQSIVPLILLVTIAAVILNISRSMLVVRKEFSRLAWNNVIQVALFNGLAITTGLLAPELMYFVVAYMVSQYLASAFAVHGKTRDLLGAYDRDALRDIAGFYRRFPFITTVSVFINTVSIYIPVFLFSIYYGAEILGIYMVAVRLLDLPLNLIKGSITQVYFQAASRLYNTDRSNLISLYGKTVSKLLFMIVPLSIIIVFARDIIDIYLGADWKNTGYIISLLLIWKIFEFLHAPISHTWSIISADGLALKLRLASIVLRFYSIYIFRDNFEHAVLAFSVASAVYYLTMNIILYFKLKKI